MVPGGLKYTKDHEWIKVEGSEAVVGITDYAQSELGDITFVELPGVGKGLSQKDTAATVESVKAASDIYSPASGEVVLINEELNDAPETINKSPYGDGWIYRIKLKDPSELDGLMDKAAYEEYLKESAH